MSVLTTAPRPRPYPLTSPRRERRPDEDRPVERPPLRLVEPPARHRVRVGLVGTVMLVVVLIGVFALAAVHTLVVQAQFELDQVEQQVAERRGDLDALRLEVATLESPSAIAEAAATIGLVNPPDRVYLEPTSMATDPGGS
jgi:cell division protein FtsL